MLRIDFSAPNASNSNAVVVDKFLTILVLAAKSIKNTK